MGNAAFKQTGALELRTARVLNIVRRARPIKRIGDLTDEERRKKQHLIADYMAQTFAGYYLAAEYAGVPAHVVKVWVKSDPYFGDLLRDVAQRQLQNAEREAWRRAFAGSDYLLTFMLKAGNPNKYRENARLEVTGADGAPLFDLTDAQRAQRVLTYIESALRARNEARQVERGATIDGEWREAGEPRADASDLL